MYMLIGGIDYGLMLNKQVKYYVTRNKLVQRFNLLTTVDNYTLFSRVFVDE